MTLRQFRNQNHNVDLVLKDQEAAAREEGRRSESDRQDKILAYAGEKIDLETRRALDSGISPSEFMAQKEVVSHKAAPNGDFSVPAGSTVTGDMEAVKNDAAIRVWDKIYKEGK